MNIYCLWISYGDRSTLKGRIFESDCKSRSDALREEEVLTYFLTTCSTYAMLTCSAVAGSACKKTILGHIKEW